MGTVERLDQFIAAIFHVLRARIAERPLLSNWTGMQECLRARMVFSPVERFRALYLDGGNRLIRDELISEGGVDRTPVHARRLLGPALEVGAASVIFVHNHPSGNPMPSRADVALTRNIAGLAAGLDILLLDHLNVGTGGSFSFRQADLLS